MGCSAFTNVTQPRDGPANLDRLLFDRGFKITFTLSLRPVPGFIPHKLGKVLGPHVHSEA